MIIIISVRLLEIDSHLRQTIFYWGVKKCNIAKKMNFIFMPRHGLWMVS